MFWFYGFYELLNPHRRHLSVWDPEFAESLLVNRFPGNKSLNFHLVLSDHQSDKPSLPYLFQAYRRLISCTAQPRVDSKQVGQGSCSHSTPTVHSGPLGDDGGVRCDRKAYIEAEATSEQFQFDFDLLNSAPLHILFQLWLKWSGFCLHSSNGSIHETIWGLQSRNQEVCSSGLVFEPFE